MRSFSWLRFDFNLNVKWTKNSFSSNCFYFRIPVIALPRWKRSRKVQGFLRTKWKYLFCHSQKGSCFRNFYKLLFISHTKCTVNTRGYNWAHRTCQLATYNPMCAVRRPLPWPLPIHELRYYFSCNCCMRHGCASVFSASAELKIIVNQHQWLLGIIVAQKASATGAWKINPMRLQRHSHTPYAVRSMCSL